MKNIYFTPGPSQIFPKITDYLNEAMNEDILSISHRSEKFEKIYEETILGFSKLLNVPNDYQIVFLSSATEAMERIIQNTVYKNSFHLISGAFGEKFYEIAKDLNKNAEKFLIDTNEELPKIDVPEESELICITQNETSNGFKIPPVQINQIKKDYPDKLIAVDIVSSAPFVNMNISKIDLIFFSVQKGFGLPAGLAVLIISPQAYEKAQHLKNRGFSIGSYHNFLNLKKYADKNQTYETPNVLDIFLLNKVVDEMNRTGIDKIRETILNNSNLIYDVAYEHNIYPHIRNVKYRSESVIVLEVQSPSKIIDRLKLKNLIIGKGYGDLKSKTIRIANFPAHTEENFEKLINKLSMLL